jgi:ATP-dependent protease ClpP protease subunit
VSTADFKVRKPVGGKILGGFFGGKTSLNSTAALSILLRVRRNGFRAEAIHDVGAHVQEEEVNMRGLISGRGLLLAAALAALLVIAATAGAAVVKNTTSGETLKGTLTKQAINGMRIFLTEDGAKRYLNMDEWQVIEEDKPAATGQAGEKPAAGKSSTAAGKPSGAKPLVYIIPIVGEIKSSFLTKAVEKALADAKARKASVVVFRMDTPGGRVDVGMKIIELIGKVDWARTIAWVNGDVQKGAISCGAFISLSTEAIYMTPGTSIGAAVPFMQGKTGSHEVDEKFQSVFAATFRSLAEKRGYPKALADAMVTTAMEGIVQVYVDGQAQYVTVEEANRMATEHKDDGKFKRSKTVCEPGKILCLTADEAVAFDLAKALTKDQNDLLNKIGLAGATVVEAQLAGLSVADWVVKQTETFTAEFQKARSDMVNGMQQAAKLDPQNNFPGSERGTSRWNDMAQRCLDSLKQSAKGIDKCEKLLAQDVSPEAAKQFKDQIADAKSQMEAMYKRLNDDLHGR